MHYLNSIFVYIFKKIIGNILMFFKFFMYFIVFKKKFIYNCLKFKI